MNVPNIQVPSTLNALAQGLQHVFQYCADHNVLLAPQTEMQIKAKGEQLSRQIQADKIDIWALSGSGRHVNMHA